jgi:uncharacterized protein YcfL
MKAHYFLFLGLAACTSTSAKESMEWNGEDITIRAEVEVLQDDVEVEATTIRGKEGRATTQFIVVNESDEPIRSHITWQWLDADGMQLRAAAGGKGERFLVLHPNQPETLTLVSPTETAVQATIQVSSVEPQ